MSLLTVRETAQKLGVGYSTIKSWIYKGSIRTIKTEGGHHRISNTEIQRVLSRHNKSPNSRTKARTNGGILVSLSGRNRLTGFIEEVRTEGLLAQVRMRVGEQVLTAVITRDAVDELQLKRGDEATALIKATEVMIGRELNK